MMGFTDVNFCPMNILDLSTLLVEAAELRLQGLYHMVGAEANEQISIWSAHRREIWI